MIRRAAVAAIFSGILVGLALGWVQTGHCEDAGRTTGKPGVVVTPAHQIVPSRPLTGYTWGAGPIVLTAHVVGEESEDLYCAEVVWIAPNGVESRHGQDCPPWAERNNEVAAPPECRPSLRKGEVVVPTCADEYPRPAFGYPREFRSRGFFFASCQDVDASCQYLVRVEMRKNDRAVRGGYGEAKVMVK